MKHPYLLAFAVALAPSVTQAQRITIRARGAGPAAALVDSVIARPHVVLSGDGALVLPRDSTITTSLVVLGRPTFIGSRVQGDVIVVGNDLFLRPGVDITGRAIAIGGTVAETTLGRVAGGVRSIRDETFLVERDASSASVVLSARSLRADDDRAPMFRLAGFYGVLVPGYDRVDGLSVPVAAQMLVANGRVVVAPSATYRSRLGVVDPGLAIRAGAEEGSRLEIGMARTTRTNDAWITADILNSAKTLAFGTDTRNYFRSDIAQARMFVRRGGEGAIVEPYVGARYERVSPITAAGNVYSFFGRTDSLKMRRPNPQVEPGHIASALAGLTFEMLPKDAPVTSRVEVEAEQSFTVPTGTSNFTQLTVDGQVAFPTFGTQRLRFHAHAVGTLGDSTPRARYAYLGGSRTLGLSDLLTFGGTELVFVDSRYSIPLDAVQLPYVGSPIVSLIHRIGGAGVGSVGTLRQEVGIALGLGPINLELITGASGQHRTEFGVGVSLPAF